MSNSNDCIGQIILEFKDNHPDISIKDKFDMDKGVYSITMSDHEGFNITYDMSVAMLTALNSAAYFKCVLRNLYHSLKGERK